MKLYSYKTVAILCTLGLLGSTSIAIGAQVGSYGDIKTTLTPSHSIQDVRPYIFSDVPADFWAATSIAVMTKEHAINGYSDGTFKPDQPLTREEAAALFANIIGDTPTVMLSSSFNDITSDRWSALAIESVAQKNIISGYGDNTYHPEKYMSRQEFAVVADNYLHYLGYTTDDPTILDDYAYGDQKFVAPWAQDAVRELASFGFLMYDKHSLFNPEKYITRAEATEITFRMTHTEQALTFQNTLYKQKAENNAVTMINKALGYDGDFTKFRNNGAMFWNNEKLYITATNTKDVKKLTDALSGDSVLSKTAVVSQGKHTQAYFDELQNQATDLYSSLEPNGKVLSVVPDLTASTLTITVDELSSNTESVVTKQFNKQVLIQLPPMDQSKWSQPIHFPLNRGVDLLK